MTTSMVANPALSEKQFKGAARRTKQRLTSRGATIASLVIAVLWTIPTLGLFLTSIRPKEDTLRTGWWTIFVDPSFTLQNYTDVLFGREGLAGPFLNSIAISIPATVFPLVIASLAGYAFAWMQFKGRDILFVLVFALQIVPIQMTLVPLLSLFSRGLNVGGETLFEGFRGAGAFIAMIVPLVVFFALQRFFVRGLLAGSTKG